MPIINNPALAQAAQNLASAFGPPSGADLHGYAQAGLTNQQKEQLAWLFANPSDPTASHRSALTGVQGFSQTPTGFGMTDATNRRGQDIGYQSNIDVAGINNAGALARQYAEPILVNENQTAVLPQQTQDATGLADIIMGQSSVGQDETVMRPDGTVMQGPRSPLSETEWNAAQNERLRTDGMLTDEDIMNLIYGDQTPVEAVGEDGNPVLMNPGAAVRAGATPAASGGSSAAEEQIERLARQFIDTGVTTDPAEARNLAVGVVDNRYVVSRDPLTGEAQILDVATELPVAGRTAPPPATDPVVGAVMADEETVQNPYGAPFANARDSFGLGGAAAGALNTVLDAVGVGAPYDDIQSTQRDFGVLKESIINDISSAYSRQPPSWLLQNIERLVPQAGSPWQGPEDALAQLNSIARSLWEERATQQANLDRPLSPSLREETDLKLSGLDAAITRVDRAIRAFGGGEEDDEENAEGPTVEAAGSAPSGGQSQADPSIFSPAGAPAGPSTPSIPTPPSAPTPPQQTEDGWITLPNGVRIREVN